MFCATLTLDGVSFIITVKDTSVSICCPDLSSEEQHLSATNAQLLASAIFAAVHEIEEGE